MKLNLSFFYLFLVWNLFLAVIPFVITSYLLTKPNLNRIVFYISFCLWLAFLPNAPYIITDFLHLRLGNLNLLWLDVLMLSSFSLNGLLLFVLSVNDMETLLSKHFRKKIASCIIAITFPLTAFGMYLGRFLRYNSWEIIQYPTALFEDIFDTISNPDLHIDAWLFTLLFGLFLSALYRLHSLFYKSN
ncbi:DUF1361 domain-containing protein [Aestuariibaculum sediminum]|uniref:DUF1361 domain-containing protein n=1 Tax=Aestuariibaculum sediminum TaxID=2770637 RepID=A0A8J6Q0X7_9FLAO|nr:DUF1361 domain-containing protein [Aestuariibaculum sediminum]MBD0830569.1 DUF1361 domain-containing protein [Aestuariibaculum sediminum]